MNGDWDPWSVWYLGMDHTLYVGAWRHVVDIFREEGATNAMWVWNPHDRSYPDFTWNDPHLYYPGDDYVDWVGLTGYNTGPRAGDPWRSFDEIYGSVYADYRLHYPRKPLLITEFSSDEQGGDKAAWIRDAFQALKRYPAIKYAVWFDFPWWKWEYRLDSSPGAFNAFGESWRDPYFRTGTVRWQPGGWPVVAAAAPVEPTGDPGLPVLMYHHLAPAERGVHRKNDMTVTVEQFRDQMAYLKSKGYVTPGLDQVAAYVERGRPLPPRSVLITFDDGYESFIQYAVPILKEFGLGAVVFAIGDRTPEVSGPFDLSEVPSRLGHLGWDQIVALSREGRMVVASHTFSAHYEVNGRPVAEGWDEDRARADLERLAAAYRDHSLTAPTAIAYPYGSAPPALVAAAKEAGYRLGFTGERGRVRPGDDPLRLKRLPVFPWMSLDRFRRLVDG